MKNKRDNHLRIGKPKRDPLTDTPDAGRVLFERINTMAREFPIPDVINGCCALLLNAMRQRNPTRAQAEADFNEIYGRMKSLLLSHYDSSSGKRRGVFPFHQILDVPYLGKLEPGKD